jgi:ABC-type branched-subunit amino acid transport system substrate-binding protein
MGHLIAPMSSATPLSSTIPFSSARRRVRVLAVAIAAILAACGGGPAPVPAKPSPAPRASVPSTITAPTRPTAARPAAPKPVEQLVAAVPAPSVPTGAAPRRKADPDGLVRVGLLIPLTGQAAPTGQGILNAAELALFEVGDERLVLQVYDTQGTPDGAAQAAALAAAQGVQLFLGPVFAGEVKAVTPQAQASGINVIAFSTDPAVAGGNVYVLGFLVDAQVRDVVAYARARGLLRIAVLAPDTIYGQSVADALAKTVPETGATLTRVAYFDPSGNDLEDVVRRFSDFDRRQAALTEQRNALAAGTDEVSQLALKRLERLDTLGDVDFDAVFIPEQGARLTQAASLLPFYDVDPGRVQLLGTMLWATRGLGREPAMIGGVFPAPAPEANRAFVGRYRQMYGANPPPLANHGYDAVALAAVLARTGAGDPFRAEALTNPAGFAGVDGIFRFRSDGKSDRGFAIMQVSRDGADVVRAAPAAFDDVQF